MCTIIVSKNLSSEFPLLIAANRDELLDRSSLPPQLYPNGILRPHDTPPPCVRQGTWIGVNQYGLFVGLTNRMDIVSQPNKTSRGDLVKLVLNCQTVEEALKLVQALEAKNYNGFHLVFGNPKQLYLAHGDGVLIHTAAQDDGWLVVTNHGIGRIGDDYTALRVKTILHNLNDNLSAFDDLEDLLCLHDYWRHGTCISDPDNNYGTKSSTIIRLAAAKNEWEYWHKERTETGKHICLDIFDEKLTLKIV